MSEHHGEGEVFDGELNLGAIVKTGVWLAVIIAVSMILMGFMAGYLKRLEQRKDPSQSPIPEAQHPTLPPAPRLQGAPAAGPEGEPLLDSQGKPVPSLTPERELDEMLDQERRVLEGYGWVSKEGGIARIPVARAIEILAAKGLPAPAPVAETIILPPAQTPGH